MRISDWSSDVCSSDLTITQQLARNIFLTNARKFARKFREAVLALALERKFDKKQILELYQIGRASCRERVCQYGVDLGGRRIIKKKNINKKVRYRDSNEERNIRKTVENIKTEN